MKRYEAADVFSQTYICVGKELQDGYWTDVVYQCKECSAKLSFSGYDFEKYALNRTSRYEGAFSETGKTNSFLEFECPNCKRKTRVCFNIGYGDKFPVVTILIGTLLE
mgnify:FL=1